MPGRRAIAACLLAVAIASAARLRGATDDRDAHAHDADQRLRDEHETVARLATDDRERRLLYSAACYTVGRHRRMANLHGEDGGQPNRYPHQ